MVRHNHASVDCRMRRSASILPIEARYFQAHATEFPKNVIRESLNGYFKFPVRAYKFPVPSEKFPVLLSREFCARRLNSFKCRRLKSHRAQEFDEIPCSFPVSREFSLETGSTLTACAAVAKNSIDYIVSIPRRA